MALDDLNHQAITGLAICLAVEGKFDEGIKLTEDVRAKYATDGLVPLQRRLCLWACNREVAQRRQTPRTRQEAGSLTPQGSDDLRESQKLGSTIKNG